MLALLKPGLTVQSQIFCQIHIHGAEQDPFAIGKRLWLAGPLQLQHVFEGEGMFALSGHNICEGSGTSSSAHTNRGPNGVDN